MTRRLAHHLPPAQAPVKLPPILRSLSSRRSPRPLLRPHLDPLFSFALVALGASLVALGASLVAPSVASAQTASTNGATSPPPPSTPSRIVEVRVGLSSSASEALSEQRMRRLLEIELDDSAVIAPGTSGPLGDHVAYVWIDLPNPARATIEVRVGERQVTRQDIPVPGLAFDVAARIVAIRTSEMVRAQMRPVRVPRKPPAPKRPTPEEIELLGRSADALTFEASGLAAFLPVAGGALGGPSMSIHLRRQGVSERLFASWLSGATNAGSTRWFEGGLGVDYRVWLSSSWRASFGAAASLSVLRLGDVASIEGALGTKDAWSARATGQLSIEAKLYGPLWLGLVIEPGAVLRPVHYTQATAETAALEGPWLGAALSLTVEWLSLGQAAPAR